MGDNGQQRQQQVTRVLYQRPGKEQREWKGKVSQEWLENRLSKRLCYILRYGALKEGLHADEFGFVDVEELLTVPLLEDHSREDILEEIKVSMSGRKTRRFELKEEHGKTLVRALYHRRMEKSPYHEGSKVPTMFESCIQVIMANLEDYDLDDFPDEFVITTMIHRLKREKKLKIKELQILLVPTLEHLDLEGLYLTNNVFKIIWSKCPNLKSISLKDCGYITTDNLISQMVKKLPNLTFLNLEKCQYLTDNCLKSIKKNCKNIKRVNISSVKTLTEPCVIDFIINCPTLERIDMYNIRISPDGRETLTEICKHRTLMVDLQGFTQGAEARESASSSVIE